MLNQNIDKSKLCPLQAVTNWISSAGFWWGALGPGVVGGPMWG